MNKNISSIVSPDPETGMFLLDSVGSLFDPGDGVIYPMDSDGDAVFDGGVHFGEVSSEWIESLSYADMRLLFVLLDIGIDYAVNVGE